MKTLFLKPPLERYAVSTVDGPSDIIVLWEPPPTRRRTCVMVRRNLRVGGMHFMFHWAVHHRLYLLGL